MKKTLAILFFLVQILAGGPATATPCVSDTLADYIALGSAGCTIGSLEFTDFGLLTPPAGSLPFQSIGVTPISPGPNVFGFEFFLGAFTEEESLDQLIGYHVLGVGSSVVVESTIELMEPSAGQDGFVKSVQNLCLGGTFSSGVIGCSGTADSLTVTHDSSVDDPIESLSFAPYAFVDVVTDINVNGGLIGAASLNSEWNLFTVRTVGTVPEPSTLSLLAFALGVLLVKKRARSTPDL